MAHAAGHFTCASARVRLEYTANCLAGGVLAPLASERFDLVAPGTNSTFRTGPPVCAPVVRPIADFSKPFADIPL